MELFAIPVYSVCPSGSNLTHLYKNHTAVIQFPSKFINKHFHTTKCLSKNAQTSMFFLTVLIENSKDNQDGKHKARYQTVKSKY